MLQKFFNPDHPINRFFSKIFCILYLNILWLLCSLPIVTIGPATTALYYTMLKVVSGDDSSTTSYFMICFITLLLPDAFIQSYKSFRYLLLSFIL